MRKSKQPPKASPPTGRVLRSNTEIADWLFGLDRRRKLAYMTRVETDCADILRQPETDPRRRSNCGRPVRWGVLSSGCSIHERW